MMKSETFLRMISVLVVLVILAVVSAPMMIYVVDQREMAVVLRFGKPVGQKREPGLQFKLPLVEKVVKLPSTRQFWGDHPDVVLPDLPTKDDKKIEVIPWAIWRITDPTVFVQRLRTIDNAQQRVAQFTRGAIRDVITQYDLAELVRSSDRPLHTTAVDLESGNEGTVETSNMGPELQMRSVRMGIQHGREKILAQIKEDAQRRLLAETSENGVGGRGIELIDLGISQIEFVESVRQETFNRWIAERNAVSARYTNEGERMRQEIVNRAKADVQRIEGEGKRQSNEIRGEVDAEIIREYADAINEVGDFYTFVRTLEAYQKAIGVDTRLILTTDSDFFKLVKQLNDVN
jgi:membrane protease subunit HflC